MTYTDTATGNTVTADVTNLTVFTFGSEVSADLSGPITSASPSTFTSNAQTFAVGQIMVLTAVDRGTPGAGVDGVRVGTNTPAFATQCISITPVFTIAVGEIVITDVLEPAELTRTAVAAEQTATITARRTATAAAQQTATAAAQQTATAAAMTATAQVTPVPTSVQQCRNGGYRAFGFKNEGQCIAFVRRGQQ